MAEKVLVGKVINYLNKIGVAIVKLAGELKTGDKISIEGAQTNFEQDVTSMQINKEAVESAGGGEGEPTLVGLKVDNPVRKKDKVYKIIEAE